MSHSRNTVSSLSETPLRSKRAWIVDSGADDLVSRCNLTKNETLAMKSTEEQTFMTANGSKTFSQRTNITLAESGEGASPLVADDDVRC